MNLFQSTRRRFTRKQVASLAFVAFALWACLPPSLYGRSPTIDGLRLAFARLDRESTVREVVAKLGTRGLDSARVIDPTVGAAIRNLQSDPESPYWDWSPARLQDTEPSLVFLEWRPRSAPVASVAAWFRDRYKLFFGYGRGDEKYYGADYFTLRVFLSPGNDWQMFTWQSGGAIPDRNEFAEQRDSFWSAHGEIYRALSK